MIVEDLRNQNLNLVSIIELEVGECFIDPENEANGVYMVTDFHFTSEDNFTIPVINLETGETDIFQNNFGVIIVDTKLSILKNSNTDWRN